MLFRSVTLFLTIDIGVDPDELLLSVILIATAVNVLDALFQVCNTLIAFRVADVVPVFEKIGATVLNTFELVVPRYMFPAIPTPPATVIAPDVELVDAVVLVIATLPTNTLLLTVKLPPVNVTVASNGLYASLVLDVLSVDMVPLVALVNVRYLLALVVVSSATVSVVPLAAVLWKDPSEKKIPLIVLVLDT